MNRNNVDIFIFNGRDVEQKQVSYLLRTKWMDLVSLGI